MRQRTQVRISLCAFYAKMWFRIRTMSSQSDFRVRQSRHWIKQLHLPLNTVLNNRQKHVQRAKIEEISKSLRLHWYNIILLNYYSTTLLINVIITSSIISLATGSSKSLVRNRSIDIWIIDSNYRSCEDLWAVTGPRFLRLECQLNLSRANASTCDRIYRSSYFATCANKFLEKNISLILSLLLAVRRNPQAHNQFYFFPD